MRKYVSLLLIICLIVTTTPIITFGAVTRTITVTKQKILPFSVTSQTASTSVSLDISGLSGVQVASKTVDNGVISNTVINGNSLVVYLINGTYSSQPKTVLKTDTIYVSNELETDETSHIITKTAKGFVTNILGTTGDFLNASYCCGAKININTDTSKGVDGFDYNQKVFDEFTISSDAANRNRDITVSKTLPYSIISVRTKSAKCNNYDLLASNISYSFTGDTVNARFIGGTPKANENTRDLTHTYQWIDRHRDGHFSPYAPASAYWAPNSYNYGYNTSGYYLTANSPNASIKSYVNKLPEADWSDYIGFKMGGKPYIYAYNQSKGIPKDGSFVSANIGYSPYSTVFSKAAVTGETFYNTERVKVSLNKDTIAYEPEGKLSSATDKISAYGDENQDTFFNSNTGKPETYVMHYTFHYGPNKHGFGGYFTYPYTCTAEYEHYKPVKRYSGTVNYTYQAIENSPGYTYNGTVTVNYTQQLTVTDNPPSRPTAILANSSQILHGPATDDYTPQSQLTYKYYYYKNSTWNYLGITYNGQTNINWNPAALGLDLANLKVGVIANDLYQDGPMGENDPSADIKLTATTDKSTLAAGDSLTVDATTDSNPECFEVRYNIPGVINGTLGANGRNSYDTMLYHVNSEWIYSGFSSWPCYAANQQRMLGVGKRVDGQEYLMNFGITPFIGTNLGTKVNSLSNVPTGFAKYWNFFPFEAGSASNLQEYYAMGNEGTIIMPGINNTRYVNVDLAKYSIYYLTDNRYSNGSVVCVFQDFATGRLYRLGLYREYFSNNTSLCYADIFTPIGINYNGCYSERVNGSPFYKESQASYYAQFYPTVQSTRIILSTADNPIAITFKGSTVKLYQSGTLIAEKTLSVPIYNLAAIGTYHGDTSQSYLAPHFGNGKHLFSKKAWPMDAITNFINGPYQDMTWYAGMGYAKPGIPDYSPWVPGTAKWRQTITFPATTRNGLYIMTVTAVNGLQKSVDIPIIVSTPINPVGNMPAKVARGSTYTVTATSSKYVNDMKLIVFGNTYTMTANGFDASGNKKWTYNLTIPQTAESGMYNQASGSFRYAEFKASIPSGDTASDYKIFEVVIPAAITGGDLYARPGETIEITANTTGYCTSASVDLPTGNLTLTNDSPTSNYANKWRRNYTVPAAQAFGTYNITYRTANPYMTGTHPARLFVNEFLNPVGDIPDNIETKTNFKLRCNTTLSAVSVAATLSPTPGAAQYTLNLVSQDSTKKYWESANIQYPEMSAGGSAGRTITAAFTAAGSSGRTESCTDTGHLWEKMEITGYELRRFLYQDGDTTKPILETLCRSQSTRLSGSEGFMLAGQRMGIKVLTKGYIDKIEMDFDGPVVDYEKDYSIKTLDGLTKKFEWDDPVRRGRTPAFSSLKELQNNYAMPRSFAGITPGTDYHNIYTTYYLIPYGTKQTLHSWYTLREESKDAFSIDKSKLLDRIKAPFTLKIKLYSGTRFMEKDIKMDVFERWDTLLNRDIRPYIDNPGDHDPVSKNTWEITDYIESR